MSRCRAGRYAPDAAQWNRWPPFTTAARVHVPNPRNASSFALQLALRPPLFISRNRLIRDARRCGFHSRSRCEASTAQKLWSDSRTSQSASNGYGSRAAQSAPRSDANLNAKNRVRRRLSPWSPLLTALAFPTRATPVHSRCTGMVSSV